MCVQADFSQPETLQEDEIFYKVINADRMSIFYTYQRTSQLRKMLDTKGDSPVFKNRGNRVHYKSKTKYFSSLDRSTGFYCFRDMTDAIDYGQHVLGRCHILAVRCDKGTRIVNGFLRRAPRLMPRTVNVEKLTALSIVHST